MPTIAARTGGIPEYVRHGDTGWLVTPGDTDGLVARLAEVLADEAARRRVAARGQAHVMAAHDIRGSVAAYEALYADLLGEREPLAGPRRRGLP
jgi:glycosyltransferase involved in cell wall biosynthesis